MKSFPNKDTQFSRSNQPSNPGRKKKIYNVLKEKGYSADDIKTAFGELAFYTEKEIETVHNDVENPMIVRIVAKLFYSALEGGDWSKIKEIVEHSIGRAKQSIDHSNEDGTLTPVNMTPELAKELAQKLKDEC